MEAGLPEIYGVINGVANVYLSGGIGAFGRYRSFPMSNVGSGDGSNVYSYDFKASRSNSIYGKSTTVQPPSWTVMYYIRAK